MRTAGQPAESRYHIQSWTTDNGLPQNTVYSVLQTPDGYLWMTTLDGLVRFDGVNFTVFNKNNTAGIESNRLKKLLLDADGNLWAVAEANYLIRYHQGKFQSYSFTEGETNYIRNVFLDRQAQIVAFTDAGLFQWRGETFVPYQPIAGETVNSSILWSKNGTFWYSARAKIYQISDHEKHEYQINSSDEITITKLFEDSRGRIWAGTQNNGLSVIENNRISDFTAQNDLPNKNIEVRLEDRDGNIWLASPNGAVIVAPDGKLTRLTTAQGLSENSLGAIYEDRENNFWIGTVRRGINRVNLQTVAFYSIADGLAAEGVTAIYQDPNEGGDIWLGGEGLTRWQAGTFSKISGNEKFGASVTSLLRDQTGRLWFGNWGTAYYYENGKFINFLDEFGSKQAVYQIYQDSRKILWFATDHGLFRYQDKNLRRLTSADGLAGDDVKLIHESADGTFWIGTSGGLTRLKDNVFTSYTIKDGLASNLVRSLYEDENKTFWIGSYDGGLTRLKDDRFTRYTSKDGLFNDGVFQILEDGRGNLWMSSNRGIYRVAKQQLNDFADGKINHLESIAYSKEDGLTETE